MHARRDHGKSSVKQAHTPRGIFAHYDVSHRPFHVEKSLTIKCVSLLLSKLLHLTRIDTIRCRGHWAIPVLVFRTSPIDLEQDKFWATTSKQGALMSGSCLVRSPLLRDQSTSKRYQHWPFFRRLSVEVTCDILAQLGKNIDL